MQKNGTNSNEPEPPPWRTSEAKKALVALLDNDVDGRIHNMSGDDVYRLSPLFQLYAKNNFKTNLRNLKDSHRKTLENVARHENALEHDRKIVPKKTLTPRLYPRFDYSGAKKLLAEDVKQGKHKEVKPILFHQSRPEYQQFPLDVFRKHIYQEELAQNGRSYWMNKKNVEQAKKR
jgi:hypothetical protein